MLFYLEKICRLSHTGPILASSGGEPFSETTAALPNCCGPGFLCWMSAAAPARLPRHCEGCWTTGTRVGIDRDEVLLDVARREHAVLSNLQFECGDATTLTFRAEFDIVTAARTLQWIAQPALAISKMKQAAKPAGVLVVLDYNHAANQWDPDPPREFQTVL